MGSVADDLREALRQRMLAMSAEERIELTARLAEGDIDLFASARRLTHGEARRLLERGRRWGRRPSRAAQGTDA